MDANVKRAFEEWKEANRALLHYQQESYFALVRLLDLLCNEYTTAGTERQGVSCQEKKQGSGTSWGR